MVYPSWAMPSEARCKMYDDELPAFVEKVQKLKAEGLRPVVIAERLGIHRTTMNDRLRRARERHVP